MEEPNGQASEQAKGQKKAAIVAVIVLVAVVAVALVAYGALSNMKSQPDSSASSSAQQYALSDDGGDITPDQALACVVYDAKGEPMSISDIAQGKPVVVNMWATWCPYCVAEMDDYQKLYDRYGDKLQFVMLNACDTQSEVSLSRDYIAEHAYTFPVYYDAEHQFMRLFSIRSLPTTIVLSDGGHVLLQRIGQIDYDSMNATLEALT